MTAVRILTIASLVLRLGVLPMQAQEGEPPAPAGRLAQVVGAESPGRCASAPPWAP